jgi:hypothetical protein
MTIQSNGHEHELEPQYGLPERLPATEKLLWQGSPDFRAVAVQVFHMRKLALYFAAMLLWRSGSVVAEGGSLTDALLSLSWPLPLALLAMASVGALAWMTARTSVYTLTDKRIVMRVGIVLTLTFNIPLRTLRSAALRNAFTQGNAPVGDIVFELAGPDHIAYLHLWPHVRPWHVARPQPMLRGVPDAPKVAAMLTEAWAALNRAGSMHSAAAAQVPAFPAPVSVGVAAPGVDTRDGRSTGHWQPSPT